MKKIYKFICLLITGIFFLSCSNNNNNLALLMAIIANSPLQILSEQNIEANKKYDLSNYAGHKAFLVVMNNNDYPKTVYKNKQTNIFEPVNYDYKFENENGVFFNIPFNAPKLDYKLIETSDFNFNRNIMKSETTLEIGAKKDFYGATEDNKTDENFAKDAELKVIGNHCYVWYKAKDEINISDEKLKTLAKTFDSIYEKETYIFGSNVPTRTFNNIINVNNNTKINIIVYDLFGDYEKTKASKAGTLGYFWSIDFFNEDFASDIKTNKCECIHIDSYFLEVAEQAQRSTIAHEFQHMLHFVNKSLNFDKTSETWFNEMMSMTCEDIMQTQLGLNDNEGPKSRLSTFNSTYPYGFTNWRDGDDVFISYANAYAFGAYLVRNYGIDFIKTLAQNQYVNKEAITNALITIDAEEKSFDQAYAKFYKTVFNPKSTKYSLNKGVESTYTYAPDKTATFNCTAINLSNYITISKYYITDEYVDRFYQASKLNDYYGPIIYNKKLPTELDSMGMVVTYLGTIGIDLDKNFKFTNYVENTRNITYKLIITF